MFSPKKGRKGEGKVEAMPHREGEEGESREKLGM